MVNILVSVIGILIPALGLLLLIGRIFADRKELEDFRRLKTERSAEARKIPVSQLYLNHVKNQSYTSTAILVVGLVFVSVVWIVTNNLARPAQQKGGVIDWDHVFPPATDPGLPEILDRLWRSLTPSIGLSLALFLLALICLQRLKVWVVEYRISKGWFGFNPAEAQTLIQFILEHRADIDLGPPLPPVMDPAIQALATAERATTPR